MDPEAARTLAAGLQPTGRQCLDAPTSGGAVRAAKVPIASAAVQMFLIDPPPGWGATTIRRWRGPVRRSRAST